MSAVKLTTPSLGVRAEVDGEEVLLRLGSEGGRGVASHILLLPVSEADPTNMCCALAWDAIRVGSDGRSTAWNVYGRELKDVIRPGPFIERLQLAEWRRAHPAQGPMLVVLVFGDPYSTESGPAKRLSFEACNDLQAMLCDDDKTAWRRRGLLKLQLPAPVVSSSPSPSNASSHGKPAPASAKPVHAAGPEGVVFALASCQYPAGIVDGTPQDFVALRNEQEIPRGPADASLLRLHDQLVMAAAAQRPSLLLLAGDQIYVDATAGLFDVRAVIKPRGNGGSVIAAEWLRVPYENWLGSVGVHSVFGLLRMRMMLDDHEIVDNWEPLVGSATSEPNERLNAQKSAGAWAYRRYQSARAGSAPHWDASFEHGGFRFFLADTRTERDGRTAASEFRKPLAALGVDPPPAGPPRIMSSDQHQALEAWLKESSERPAFILSPSIFLPRRLTSRRTLSGALHSDAWDGYPSSLEGVLAWICKTRRRGLVFLSGDEHVSCVVQATVRACGDDGTLGESVELHSIHSSALYAPYPFANAVPEEFPVEEHWCFPDPAEPTKRYRCDVKVLRWVPGDGFACLHLHHEGGSGQPWHLDVEFDREGRDSEIVKLTL